MKSGARHTKGKEYSVRKRRAKRFREVNKNKEKNQYQQEKYEENK